MPWSCLLLRGRRVLLAMSVGCVALAGTALGVPGDRADSTAAIPTEDPRQAAAAFGLPAGFTIDLFAAEPDVQNPVAFSIDERGNVYVCETFRQNRGITDNRGHDRTWVEADLAAQTVADRIAYHHRLLGDEARSYERYEDRVRRLVDADGDGRADRAEVFCGGFRRLEDGTAAGILARGGDVYLTCIPSLYRLRDLDGDGRVDHSGGERAVLSSGYGVRVAYRGHDLHGLTLGPDGRIYFTVGDRGFHVEHDGRVDHDPGRGAVFRCEPDGSHLEVVATGLRNPQELAFDDLGNLFTVDNNSDGGDKARLVHLALGSDAGWRMEYQYLDDRGPWNREKIWHTATEGQPAFCLPPVAHVSSGPSGLAAYPGTGLTSHFDGRFLLVDFRGGAATSSIRSFRVTPAGGSFVVADEEETITNVLATDVEIGPDGALWIADWVHGWDGEGKGRIWRVFPAARAEGETQVVADVQALLAGDWATLDGDRLVALLAHRDRRIRHEAQWELARRHDDARLMQALGDESAPVPARVHAAQGLGQRLRLGAAAAAKPLLAAAEASAPGLRLVIARCLGDCPPNLACRREVRRCLAARLIDPDLHVAGTAATSLAHLGRHDADDPAVADAVIAFASSPAVQDRAIAHAAAAALTAIDPVRFDALVRHASPQVRLITCVALRRLADDRLALLLTDSDATIATEAARAVHDLPLEHLLPALAACAASGPADEGFLRRAVSAAEQVGGRAGAVALAAVISRDDTPAATRQEAIDALRSWAEPPRVNRVNGVWLPRSQPRDAAVARDVVADSLGRLLTSKAAVLDESLRGSLLAAASHLGVPDVAPMLRRWCTDASLAAASRAGAIDALLEAGDAEVAALADRLLTDREPLVRMASRRVRVASMPPAAVVPDLVSACGSPDVAERQQAVQLLGSLSEPAATEAVAGLRTRLRDGALDPTIALEVREAAALRLGEMPDEVSPADPLAAWSDVISGGDPSRGRHVFFTKVEVSCVRCHEAEGRGGDVGPKLDGIAGRRDAAHLLAAVVTPNAHVAEGYATTVIVTDEGQSVSGIVVAETPEAVTLKLPEGTTKSIAVEHVEERASGPSSMPADLAGKLSRRDLRDLLAWLQSLR